MHTLGEQEVMDHLTQRYGKAPVQSARVRAEVWMGVALANTIPDISYESYAGTQELAEATIDAQATGGLTPQEMEEVAADDTPEIWGPKPEPFSSEDSEIILSAIRKSAGMHPRKSYREDRLRYLICHSPKRTDRVVARVAMRALRSTSTPSLLIMGLCQSYLK